MNICFKIYLTHLTIYYDLIFSRKHFKKHHIFKIIVNNPNINRININIQHRVNNNQEGQGQNPNPNQQ